jgi:hypothetical protein
VTGQALPVRRRSLLVRRCTGGTASLLWLPGSVLPWHPSVHCMSRLGREQQAQEQQAQEQLQPCVLCLFTQPSLLPAPACAVTTTWQLCFKVPVCVWALM